MAGLCAYGLTTRHARYLAEEGPAETEYISASSGHAQFRQWLELTTSAMGHDNKRHGGSSVDGQVKVRREEIRSRGSTRNGPERRSVTRIDRNS